jgi:hypothetical protein
MTEQQGRPEQRRAARKLLQAAGVLTLGGLAYEVTTVDVAPGGLCIMAAKQLAVGRDCHVNFGIPTGGELRNVAVTAHVVYCFFRGEEGYKVGLQFLKVHADGGQVIADYLARPQ